ncbi:DegV family protein [Streptococcus sobrinus]|uniref:EDD domain protein, DegV family n=9 Tax=Streptococcus sobrinus TaxID=1310 RepID=U2KHQ3_9STRE|nr:DegV family protein [Streptococcus sobrinus]AWN18827.1 DegV family protein [Streptococcus sobrinus]AWN61703.1 DegV family protein [Streptococcus sobrinus]AWN63574.1 DegV family protein [Streptococcus sobrinus]ERJ74378.1 EDD domain protein, DegV family [Streptococcus sobrinus W1703]OZV23530.1 DegV family protein [Streptococcus sobrinus]
MKLAVITDSSVYLPQAYIGHPDLYVLDIPIMINGETYVEGKNLTIQEFYPKMQQASSLPKTSQPSIADLDDALTNLEKGGYTHVLGIFLSSGISGFWQNIQYLIEEHSQLTIAFPDSKITSSPMGYMVTSALDGAQAGHSFEQILAQLETMIAGTEAFIMVDDLDHLVKGGRLSNGAALLGNLLNIKPIMYFNDGVIEVFEKVRTEKKALKRLVEILDQRSGQRAYKTWIIEANAQGKAESFRERLLASGFEGDLDIVPFCGVISTHLGEGAVAVGFTPKAEW